MDYQKLYDSIISNALNRDAPGCYCEKHHIIPKSLGGLDSKDNIAILTAREHFIAHWLLKKIYNNKEMIYAFHAMTKPVGNGRVRYTSRSFKYAREALAKYLSENRSGENHPMYGVRGKDNPNYGRKRGYTARKRMSEAARKRDWSNHPNRRKIQCVETGEVFESISAAKKKHTKGNIAYALSTGGTAGGFRFVYLGEEHKSNLKGYASGERSHVAVKVVDDLGNVFHTIKAAANSIGVSGSAISASIRGGRPCKGRVFRRV